jgi:hypothetical protein
MDTPDSYPVATTGSRNAPFCCNVLVLDIYPSREMAQAFISYSQEDAPAAERLVAELEKRGMSVVGLHDQTPLGADLVQTIEQSVKSSDVVLVVVSPSSVGSPWVAAETFLAMSQARSHGHPLVVPVLLQRDVQLPILLRHIQGITLFDRERAERQLDELARSIESKVKRTSSGEPSHVAEADLRILLSAKAGLEAEKIEHARLSATRSLGITGAIAGFAMLAAVGITAWANIWTPVGHSIASAMIGIAAGAFGSLLASRLWRRERRSDPRREKQ